MRHQRPGRLAGYAGRTALLLGFVLLAAGVAANACSGSPLGPSGPPNLRLLLTDDFTDAVEEVRLHFTTVTVKPSGQPVEHDLQITLDPNPVDLLTLTDGKLAEFAEGVLEPGDYEFIHIKIDEAQSGIVESGDEKPLRVPSERVKVLGGFTILEGQVTTLTLDFDAKASLVRLGNGEWLLKPVIIITHDNVSPQP